MKAVQWTLQNSNPLLETVFAKEQYSGTIFQRTVLGKQNFLAEIPFIWGKGEVIYPSEHYCK